MRTASLLRNCGTKGILSQYKLSAVITGSPGVGVVPGAPEVSSGAVGGCTTALLCLTASCVLLAGG